MVSTWEFLLRCEYMGSVDSLGAWHKFQSYSLNNGMSVALRLPELGLYLNRYYDGLQYMSPMDYGITVYSTLGYDAGSTHLTDYEVLEVIVDTSEQDPNTYVPILVDVTEIINDSNLTVTKTG